MEYIESLNEEIKEYYKILLKQVPEFLYDYIDTPEMKRIAGTGTACGTDYTKIFNNKFYYSNLAHSIGVALIVWNFTHNKAQTLAGLFHDIASPTFKHCIDFMNGDSETQESTEAETEDIIKNSKEIMSLLKRDGITLEEVKDYHIYPIADNDTPKLSSDRLEYTLTNAIYFKEVWTLDEIKQIYEDISVLKNEEGIDELGFNTLKIAEKFIDGASKLWPLWISNEDKLTMQFFADILKEMSSKDLIQKKDLYTLSELEIIEKIRCCGDKRIEEAFERFQNATKVYGSNKYIEDKYCVNVKSKKRYIIPLVKQKSEVKRIDEISKKAKEKIEGFLNNETEKYAYVDFNF